MKTIFFSLIFLFASSFALATENSPLIKKTVTAFTGTWVGEMTATTPYDAPETFSNKMDCKTIASGMGVECSSEGTASIGTLTQTCLIAFDSDKKEVHYMCVSSMGEVHDHKGNWIDDKTIQYDLYEGTMNGEKITENISTSFPDEKTMIHTSEIIMKDGSKMSFVFKAQKQ